MDRKSQGAVGDRATCLLTRHPPSVCDDASDNQNNIKLFTRHPLSVSDDYININP